ncbi:MAG: hypothetical protein ABEK02_05725 [Haloquadratum sp.]
MEYTWQYYDLLLLGIAVSMLLGAGVGVMSPVAVSTAVTGAGLVSAVFIGYGLFVNGPVEDPDDLTEPVDALN